MNPSSTKLFITTNSSTLGFLSTEVNEGCGTLVNVIVTLAEPFMPPYSSLYMCDYMCLKKTPLLPTGFSRKGLECGIENCNKNSTVYVFSQPLAGSWGCFFPFGGSGQRDSYPSFWTTTILLSLFCLIGFSLNVALIVMSSTKRMASLQMRKIIIAVCVCEAVSSLIHFLDRFIYFQLQGGRMDTIMNEYIQNYVIDPIFVRTFCSCILLAQACCLQAFRTNAFERMTNSKLLTIAFCLIFPVSIYAIYCVLCHPIAQLLKDKAGEDVLMKGIAERLTDKTVIGGVIFALTIFSTFIMNMISQCWLSERLVHAAGTTLIENLKDNKSAATCVSLLLLAEILALIPVFCSLYSFVTVQLLQWSPNWFSENIVNTLIPLAFLWETWLPICIAVIIATVYRPYRRYLIDFFKFPTRPIKIN